MADVACREILDTARRMVVAQQLVSGDDTMYRQGPNDEWWRFRMYKNGRGYLHLNVTSRDFEGILYSIDAIKRELRELYAWSENGDDDGGDGDAQMDDQEDHGNHAQNFLAAKPAVSEEFRNLCAHRIQTAYRAHRMWSTRSRRLRMQHQLAILMQQIQMFTNAMPQQESAFEESALSEIARMESRSCRLIVPHLPLFVVDIPADTNAVNILTLMTDPTNLDRDDVRVHAMGLAAEWGEKTMPYKCARAVLSGTPYPLIIGSLPLPSIPVMKWKSNATDVVLFVRCGTTLHDDHQNLLRVTFKEKFLQHVLETMNSRAVSLFDFYMDSRMTQHIGSLVVSKFLARLRGKLIPVVHIESIASVTKGQGAGTRMFDFCKSLVLSGNLTYGILLAECLRIDFWEYRMNETTEGKAMIVQLQKLYDDVAFEPQCTMRTREVRVVDDSCPSPMKQLA
jgi:hypothetical protein